MRINYANRPLYENPEIQSLTVSEFETIVAASRGHRFKWTEAVGPIKEPSHAGYDPSITKSLVICKTDFGFSVFTLRPIAKGTRLFSYAGEARSGSDIGLEDVYLLKTPRIEGCDCVTARYQSNWGGLVQYAQDRGFMGTHFIDAVEHANLKTKEGEDGCVWFYAARDIEAGTQLSWDYSASYVLNLDVRFEQFDRQGRNFGFKSFVTLQQVFNILYCVAKVMGDKDILKELARAMPSEFAKLERLPMVSNDRWKNAYGDILSMPDDFWRCLQANERDLLSNFFRKNLISVDKAELERKIATNPYESRMLARFRVWCELPVEVARTLPAGICALRLSIPADFSLGNAARYYLGYKGIPAEEANRLITQSDAEAKKYLKANNFLLAIAHFQLALRAARDALSYLWVEQFQAKTAGAGGKIVKPSYEACEFEKNVYFFDERVVVAFWNLSSAYLKASELTEAEYCMTTALTMIKASEVPDITKRLAKYEERLIEIRARISTLTPAAAGGAGAAMPESPMKASAGLFAVPKPAAALKPVINETSADLTAMSPPAAGGAGDDSKKLST